MSAIAVRRSGVRVKAGEVVGWSGDSGCTWGYVDYPRRPNRHIHQSWDGPHLHFEVFTKYKSGKRKLIDPFGLYADYRKYPCRLLTQGNIVIHNNSSS